MGISSLGQNVDKGKVTMVQTVPTDGVPVSTSNTYRISCPTPARTGVLLAGEGRRRRRYSRRCTSIFQVCTGHSSRWRGHTQRQNDWPSAIVGKHCRSQKSGPQYGEGFTTMGSGDGGSTFKKLNFGQRSTRRDTACAEKTWIPADKGMPYALRLNQIYQHCAR